MTLRHLKTFVEVYHAKSISGAARNLHMAQPSISIIIKELESYYGVKFFDRSSKHLTITTEGHIMYEHAIRVVSQFAHIDNAFKKITQEQSLHLAVGISVGRLFMPTLYKGFKQAHPDVELFVKVYPSPIIEDLLCNGNADFAILENTAYAANLVQIPLEQSPLVVIAPKGHPLESKKDLTLKDLVEYDLLLREPHSDTRTAIDRVFAAEGLFLAPLWESHSTLALINAVSEGLGLSILPLIYVSAANNPEICILDIDLHISRSINICYSKTRSLSTAALKFIDYLGTDNLMENLLFPQKSVSNAAADS